MDEFVLALNLNGFQEKEQQYRKLIVAYCLYCMACEKESAFKYPFSLRRVRKLCEEAGLSMSDQPVFHAQYDALDWFKDKMWAYVVPQVQAASEG